MTTNTSLRKSFERRCSQQHSPFFFLLVCIFKLLILIVAVGDGTRNLWVRAQFDDSFCYDDLYLSDENGDGKVDSEEYVTFCRLRLEQLSEVEYTSGISPAVSTTFVLLPSSLQSNFYMLSCLCSRFDFDNTNADNTMCCVGDNAHLSIVTTNNSVGVEETMNDEELLYANLVCSFTNRAIDNVIDSMEPPPTNSPVEINTSIPTTAPTTPKQITLPTIAPTISPTASPSIMTTQPRITPSSHPSISSTISQPSTIFTSSMQPTTLFSPTSSSPTIHSTTILPTTPALPTNITVETSYSILVEEQHRLTLQDIFNIRKNCTEAMDLLATKVSTQLWFDDNITLEKSVFHNRLFVELPTTVNISDIGFTPTPKFINMKFNSGDEIVDNYKNDRIFGGGPCPTEMIFKEDESTPVSRRPKYSCLEVRSSIFLKVIIDDAITETGISVDDVQDLYLEVLEREIMRGELAYIFENSLKNSKVIMATGQTVPMNADTTQQTKGPTIRVGVIVGLVAVGLLLIMILVCFSSLRSKRQNHRAKKENAIKPFASADTFGEEDIESKKNQDDDLGETWNVKAAASSSVKLKIGQQHKQQTLNEYDGTNFLATKTAPYFQTDTSPGTIVNADDAKSTGAISAESDAGWSEAYTSSMGSASDDGICGLDSPSGSFDSGAPPTAMQLSMGPSFTSIETEDVLGISPMKDIRISNTSFPATPTSPKSTIPITPISPIAPKSIQLLEESTSDNGDEILIHEDFSDEDDDDDDDSNDNNLSQHQYKQSSEDFREKVHALIERIVPEEISQIDDMISQFKNREDELIETLLAMEKRALAQKKNMPTAIEKDIV